MFLGFGCLKHLCFEMSQDIQPPEWLTQDFVQNALREGFQDKSLSISKYSITPATSAGDNYVSQIFRAKITMSSSRKKNEILSVIIKSLPKGEHMELFVHECQLFTKESRFLADVMPKMHRLFANVGWTHRWSPQVYFKQGPPQDLIFMEDLRERGYKVADRKTGLDLQHCVMVLESLAVLHAGSLALMENEPEIMKQFNRGFWEESNEKVLYKILTDGVSKLADVMQTWKDLPLRYTQKIRNLEDKIMKKTFDTYRRDDNKFNVLLHGDTWTNNFMFRYEEGAVENLKFVDFQLSSFNSPVFDLLYFVFTSPKEELKLKSLDFFLETYHKKLSEVCQSLNVSNFNFSLKDLKTEFHERLFFGLVVSICIFPITIAQGKDVIDPNELLESTQGMDNIFKCDRFVKTMRLILPFFEEHGAI